MEAVWTRSGQLEQILEEVGRCRWGLDGVNAVWTGSGRVGRILDKLGGFWTR